MNSLKFKFKKLLKYSFFCGVLVFLYGCYARPIPEVNLTSGYINVSIDQDIRDLRKETGIFFENLQDSYPSNCRYSGNENIRDFYSITIMRLNTLLSRISESPQNRKEDALLDLRNKFEQMRHAHQVSKDCLEQTKLAQYRNTMNQSFDAIEKVL